MKRVLLALVFCLTVLSSTASEYSDFAAKQYGERCNKENVKITVKKEHVEQYAQEVGSNFIPYIAYGYGDLKAQKCRKQRISYICLLDCDLNPIWSYIVESK
ncbi:hypothetical protein IJ750_06710 [bacterium]|nr:hypothetical protein [bacterium]